jgi:hypothetical protein
MKSGSANKETRGKLEEYFNPGPSNSSKLHDIEDSNDIYDHTKEFFNKS